MIRAVKSKAFDRVFSLYNHYYLLRRRFRSFTLSGSLDPHILDRKRLDGVLPIAPDQPVVYFMNHSSWWDGLLLYHAAKQTSRGDHYVMMEERQLRQYAFFRKLGAYSINKDSASGVRTSLQYTNELLAAGKRVWIFPQGEILHQEARPIQFRPGIGLVLRRFPQAIAVPVTLCHGMVQHDLPEISMKAGLPIVEDWKTWKSEEIAHRLGCVLEQQLNDHRATLIRLGQGSLPDAQPLIRGIRSTSEKYDAARKRVNR
ncbi:lysophospholipid acyltransferase family protein [Paenibacillus polysaccharolyticus]|uniref:lysophospholipid acyltransferase family protein n=1 Tax=Paenibacillus polysaccharolyticus TaxID=582692 RepID=UPI0020A0AAD6|nr:lysophospholipid acyltransferase family protein [Paenibacillus polysaccharolyticus]MCP1137374.1 lysophospholipid acyltransferase family protein [Paenibacillus polysaccharolyticus]